MKDIRSCGTIVGNVPMKTNESKKKKKMHIILSPRIRRKICQQIATTYAEK